MNIVDLIPDILIYITDLLDDRDKLFFISSCKNLYYTLKDKIIFDQEINPEYCHTNYPGENFRSIRLTSPKYLEKFPNVIELTVEDCDVIVPKTVRRLNLIHVPKIIPSWITHLVFPKHFNQSVDNLPDSITHLTFGDHFNTPIKKLPASLVHLEFGFFFDQPVNGIIPSSVISLIFGGWCKQSASQAIPAKIEILKFRGIVHKDIDLSLFRYLKTLELTYTNGIPEIIPESVKHLGGEYYNGSLSLLTINLTSLHLKYYSGELKDALPLSLEKLVIDSGYNRDIMGVIPPKLKYLSLGDHFNRPIYGLIELDNENSVVKFGIKKYLPDSLEVLIFGDNFNQGIAGGIPSNVKRLVFGRDFDRSIKNSIPSSVEYLEFGVKFSQTIYEVFDEWSNDTLTYYIKKYIPDSARKLIFSAEYRKHLEKWHLPKYLRYIKIDRQTISYEQTLLYPSIVLFLKL